MSRTRVLLIAAAVAVFVGIVATIAGGLLIRDHSWYDCTANPTVYYGMYGWPMEWRTDAPYRMIEATEADRGLWGYNREGFSFGRFALVVLLFSAPVIMVEATAFAAWRVWRALRRVAAC